MCDHIRQNPGGPGTHPGQTPRREWERPQHRERLGRHCGSGQHRWQGPIEAQGVLVTDSGDLIKHHVHVNWHNDCGVSVHTEKRGKEAGPEVPLGLTFALPSVQESVRPLPRLSGAYSVAGWNERTRFAP